VGHQQSPTDNGGKIAPYARHRRRRPRQLPRENGASINSEDYYREQV